MDEEDLILAGLRSPDENKPGPAPAPFSTSKTIIKPAWLSNTNEKTTTTSGAEEPGCPTEGDRTAPQTPVNTSTPAPKSSAKSRGGKTTNKRKATGTAPYQRKTRATGYNNPPSIDLTEEESDETMMRSPPVAMDQHPPPQPKASAPTEIDSLKAYFDGKLDQLKNDITREVSTAVCSQVKQNAEDIRKVREEMANGIKERVAQALGEEMQSVRTEIDKLKDARVGIKPRPHMHSKPSDESPDYWRARRGVRCWPISGPPDDLWGQVGDFFAKTLSIPGSKLNQGDVESIRRIASKRNEKKIKNEVLVTFRDVATRDMIFSYASNLAQYRDLPEPPGIRMEIPMHLNGVFRTLDEYGHTLRQKAGPDFRRNIRFDDSQNTLYMDIYIPNDRIWTRVDATMAAEEVARGREALVATTRQRISSITKESTPASNDVRQAHLPPSRTLQQINKNHAQPPRRWAGDP